MNVFVNWHKSWLFYRMNNLLLQARVINQPVLPSASSRPPPPPPPPLGLAPYPAISPNIRKWWGALVVQKPNPLSDKSSGKAFPSFLMAPAPHIFTHTCLIYLIISFDSCLFLWICTTLAHLTSLSNPSIKLFPVTWSENLLKLRTCERITFPFDPFLHFLLFIRSEPLARVM